MATSLSVLILPHVTPNVDADPIEICPLGPPERHDYEHTLRMERLGTAVALRLSLGVLHYALAANCATGRKVLAVRALFILDRLSVCNFQNPFILQGLPEVRPAERL